MLKCVGEGYTCSAAIRGPGEILGIRTNSSSYRGLCCPRTVLGTHGIGQASTWRLVTGRYSMSSTARDSERYMALFAW